MFKNLSQSTRTALYVGGGAVAAGLLVYLWKPKDASAATKPVIVNPADTGHWVPVPTFEPGGIYMVATMLAPGQVVDRLFLASMLQAMNWANGSVLFAPGDDPSTWPTAMPRPSDEFMMKSMYVFVGTWAGEPGTHIDARNTMMPMKWVG